MHWDMLCKVITANNSNNTTHIYGYRQNVAFKVAKKRDSIMEDQDELIIRKSECEDLGLEANTKAVLEVQRT